VLKKHTKNLEVQKNYIPNKTGNVPKPTNFPVLFVILVGGQFWKEK
jgi:hypothetical protein